jgi:hypothetical protein
MTPDQQHDLANAWYALYPRHWLRSLANAWQAYQRYVQWEWAVWDLIRADLARWWDNRSTWYRRRR